METLLAYVCLAQPNHNLLQRLRNAINIFPLVFVLDLVLYIFVLNEMLEIFSERNQPAYPKDMVSLFQGEKKKKKKLGVAVFRNDVNSVRGHVGAQRGVGEGGGR